jgi:chromosome segregation ATPase
MKYLGPLLAGGLTLIIVVVIGIFSFLPRETPAQPMDGQSSASEVMADAPVSEEMVRPALSDSSQLEQEFARRETTYQAQLTRLDQALKERQTAYQDQIQQVGAQVVAVEQTRDELKAQEQILLAQVAELETTRAERLSVYQAQVQQARDQYGPRLAELQTRLGQTQVDLAEARAQLGQ